jgi:excisionase family DNA binding protein
VQVTEYPVTITVEEAAELVGMSRSAAYRAAARGQLPTVRLGRRLRVPTAKFLSMLGLDGEQAAVVLADGQVRRLVGAEPEEAA